MSSWRRVDGCPPTLGETVLLRGKGGGMYVGWAYETSGGVVLYQVPNHRGSVSPVWWCPIPEFGGDDGDKIRECRNLGGEGGEGR